MSDTTVIEIVAEVTDKTKTGAESAIQTMSNLEKAALKAQEELVQMQKTLENCMKAISNFGHTNEIQSGVESAAKSVSELETSMQNGAEGAAKSVSKLEQAVHKAQAEISRIRKMGKIELTMYAVDKASKVINSVFNMGSKIAGKVWNVTVGIIDKVTAPIRGIRKLIANPITAVMSIAGVGLGFADIVNTYKDFEQGMANVKAISGATDAEFAALTDTAKRLGEETMFSATQTAEAMEYLAMAGWKSNDIISGMDGLLNLAAAGSIDLATAADVTSSALAQFNMQASESTRVADVLAATATNSKTDVQGLGESLKYVGTQAGALGYSIEDTALMLGIMGNAGIDASSAGTALRTTLARMAKQGELTGEETAAVAKEMNALGVSLVDTQGNTKPLIDVVKDLRTGFSKLSDAQKVQTASNLAGMYAQSGLLALVNASEEDFNKLAEAIANSAGAAEEMSDIKMDTLQGSLYYLQSAAEGVKIAIGEKLRPYLKEFVDWLTAAMPTIKNAALEAIDFIVGKIDKFKQAINDMKQSAEWASAGGIWNKIKIAWNKLIAEPFDEWWNSSGKVWLAGKAQAIGKGIGTAITMGVSALFGSDKDIIGEGMSIGAAFGKGFADGFDGEKVAQGIMNALKSVIKAIFSNPVTGTMATLWLGGKAAGGISSAYNIGSTVKSLFQGMEIANAARTGGAAVVSNLGIVGNAFGSSASGIGAAAAGASGLAGAAVAGTTLVSAISDFSKAAKVEDKRESDAYKASAGWKAGGVATGAIAGAVIGSVIPVVGTAVGALIGAGIGGVVGMVGGNNSKKRYEEAIEQEKEAEAAAILAKEQAKYSSSKLRDALADSTISQAEFNSMFQQEVMKRLSNRFGNISLTLKEIQSMAKKITFDGAEKSFEAFSSAAAQADDDLARLQNTASGLAKINWKRSLGLKWTQEDNSEFVSTTQSMISEAQKLILDKNYEAQTAVNLIYGDNKSGADEMIKNINGVYADLQGQIDEKAQSINIILNKNGGVLSLDEMAEVNNLVEQIEDISAKVAQAQSEAKLDFLNIKYGGVAMDQSSYEQLVSELTQERENAIAALDDAYKNIVVGLELKAEKDPNFNLDEELQKVTAQYQEDVSGINDRYIDFQLEYAVKLFEAEDSEILPGLEGDLQERIKTALEAAVAVTDPVEWDSTSWLRVLGLKEGAHNEELAGQLSQILSPIAQTMHEDFLRQNEKPSDETARKLFEMFKTDMARQFNNKEIEVNPKIKINPDLMFSYSSSWIQGSFNGHNPVSNVVQSSENSIYANKQFVGPVKETNKGITYKAKGGITTGPQLSVIGEAGPEAIIPLTGANKKYGVMVECATRFQSYDIMNVGEIKLPMGEELTRFSWRCKIPGQKRQLKNNYGLFKNPFIIVEKDPQAMQQWFSYLRNSNIKCKLLITETPVNHNVYLENYTMTYSGGYGDYDCDISFIHAKELKVSTQDTSQETTKASVSPENARPSKASESSYTVKSGDTLWDIAQKNLGAGSKYTEIAQLNGISNPNILKVGQILILP